MNMKLNPLGTIYSKKDIENAFIAGGKSNKNFNEYFEDSYCTEKSVSDNEIEQEIIYQCDSDYVPELKAIFKDKDVKLKIIDTFKHFLTTFEARRESLNFKENNK